MNSLGGQPFHGCSHIDVCFHDYQQSRSDCGRHYSCSCTGCLLRVNPPPPIGCQCRKRLRISLPKIITRFESGACARVPRRSNAFAVTSRTTTHVSASRVDSNPCHYISTGRAQRSTRKAIQASCQLSVGVSFRSWYLSKEVKVIIYLIWRHPSVRRRTRRTRCLSAANPTYTRGNMQRSARLPSNHTQKFLPLSVTQARAHGIRSVPESHRLSVTRHDQKSARAHAIGSVPESHPP